MTLYSELCIEHSGALLTGFRRLMSRLNYDNKRDTLIHVGDLVAKGENHIEVLDWMIENNIQGVRGNHDQPVSYERNLMLRNRTQM